MAICEINYSSTLEAYIVMITVSAVQGMLVAPKCKDIK